MRHLHGGARRAEGGGRAGGQRRQRMAKLGHRDRRVGRRLGSLLLARRIPGIFAGRLRLRVAAGPEAAGRLRLRVYEVLVVAVLFIFLLAAVFGFVIAGELLQVEGSNMAPT